MQFTLGHVMMGVAVIGVVAVVVAMFFYVRYRGKEQTHHICILTDSTAVVRDLPRDEITVRDSERRWSCFLDGAALRRRASGSHEAMLFVYDWSATPVYPGRPAEDRRKRVDAHNGMVKAIALRYFNRARQEKQGQAATGQRQYIYKYVVMGVVIVVLVVSIFAMVMSGKVAWPF